MKLQGQMFGAGALKYIAIVIFSCVTVLGNNIKDAAAAEISSYATSVDSAAVPGQLEIQKVIHLEGEIQDGDAQLISDAWVNAKMQEAAIRSKSSAPTYDAPTIVHLSSPGGSVAAAFEIVNQLRRIETYGPTLIAVDDVCASACTIVFFSFPNRFARLCDLIGVHRASINGEENSSSFEASTEIADYLIKSGLPWEIVRKMLETSASQIAWLTISDLNLAGIELLDTTCPRTEQGSEASGSDSSQSDYNLALKYIKGDGLPVDEALGFKLAMKSAEAGNVDGEFLVGILYANGIGVPVDPVLASTWYEAAAMRGHPQAAFNLALMYENGVGVSRDINTAVNWYKVSASKKMASAALNLGLLYLRGETGRIDEERGLLWLSIGGYLGDKASEDQAAETAKNLSTSSIDKVGLEFSKCLSNSLINCDL